MTNIKQKITPNLWFDRYAEEAAKFYTSIFKNSRVGKIIRASKAGFEIHGLSGGTVLMELGEYPFSEKYGWTQDMYGLSWQVMFMGDRKMKQKITPTLMFVGGRGGKAEA